MRFKKIRGHNRRQKDIRIWRNNNISLDLTGYILKEYDRYHAKIRVHPWSGISLTNSAIPQPSRKTKLEILSGLLDIYDNWKEQLDNLGQPYYLKLWLFEPHFSKSQVVCAIGDSIDFYENTFHKPEKEKELHLDNYSSLRKRLEKLKLDYRFDEDYYTNDEVGSPSIYSSQKAFEETQKWFSQLLKKPHRTTRINNPNIDATEVYSFKRGEIWLCG